MAAARPEVAAEAAAGAEAEGSRRSRRAASVFHGAAVERRQRGVAAESRVEGASHVATLSHPPKQHKPKPAKAKSASLCPACGKECGKSGEGGEGEVAEEVVDEVAGLCGACALRWQDGSYCPVCSMLWEDGDGDMLGCMSLANPSPNSNPNLNPNPNPNPKPNPNPNQVRVRKLGASHLREAVGWHRCTVGAASVRMP